MFFIFLVFRAICPTPVQAEESKFFCMIDTTTPLSVFHCRDEAHNSLHKRAVRPLEEVAFTHFLESKGVEIVSSEEYLKRTLLKNISQLIEGPLERLPCGTEYEYRTYSRSKEFNALTPNHPTIKNLKVLAEALHSAGVCDTPVREENFNSIGIHNSDDLIKHFLCISNSESVFGTENIGQGGRGPWGIHPMHNQKADSIAYVSGQQILLKKDGLCHPSQSVVRDENGNEIKTNEAYFNINVISDNAKCAIKLYRTPGSLGGFSAWGTGTNWGSNRHCSKESRERLNFAKHIGALSCCSIACKNAL